MMDCFLKIVVIINIIWCIFRICLEWIDFRILIVCFNCCLEFVYDGINVEGDERGEDWFCVIFYFGVYWYIEVLVE